MGRSMRIINKVSDTVPLTVLASTDQAELIEFALANGLILSGDSKKFVILGNRAFNLCVKYGVGMADREEKLALTDFYKGE